MSHENTAMFKSGNTWEELSMEMWKKPAILTFTVIMIIVTRR